jgi:hypothetical protein
MVESLGVVRTMLKVGAASPLIRAVAFVGLIVVGALSLRISLTNAFFYNNWADSLSYAEGARRIYGSVSPYSETQLAGPYPIDHASFGLGFVYPPSGAYLLAPFTLGEPFWLLWNALSFVAVIGVVNLIVRREFGHLTLAWALASSAAAAVLFQVGLTDLKTGYLSPMVAAGVGAMWLWPRWSAIPALLFGLIKAFPAVGLLWTIRKGGIWRLPLVAAVAAFGLATLAHPTFLSEWVVALANAQPACPEFALPSFGCLGFPWIGYALAIVLLALSWKAARDDVSFLLMGLAMTVPLPDLYWGNLMVPMMAALPLVASESRRFAASVSPARASQGSPSG